MNKQNGLSAWQLTMLALGTVIGGSFFLGSAVAINAAGPSILLCYILGGVIIYFILFALSEMTVANPDTGSFRSFAAEAFGPGMGFVVGWVYWTGMVLAMSSEATAASILIREWYPNISISFMGSAIIISVTLINLLGADKLSKLESGLALLKIFAIAVFIIMAGMIITGLMSGTAAIGAGEVLREPLMPGGIRGIAGSMLIIIFAYAGFEIIGLAASEAKEPKTTVPKAIRYTIISLVGIYILSVIMLLPLVPTAVLNEEVSPMVAAFDRWGIGWAGMAINFVLITAILSTMLASMFGLGRMMRSLTDEGLAPKLLKDKSDVPYRGIIFSGMAMLAGLGIGLLLPKVYLFLVSSGGFALLFTYVVIVATHIRFRKKNGCPPDGKCQMPWYPYSSWIILACMIAIIGSMPFIKGQGSGMIAGIAMVISYSAAYLVVFKLLLKKRIQKDKWTERTYSGNMRMNSAKPDFSAEFSNELTNKTNKNEKVANSNSPEDCHNDRQQDQIK